VFPRVASGPAFAALRRGEQWFATANLSFGGSVVRSQVYSPIADLSARLLAKPFGVAAAKADHHSRPTQRERASAFTLIELFVVIGIIGLLMVLIVPAFTSLRSGTDVTSAAYTIKGVLDGVQLFFRELRSAVSVERGDK